MIRRCRKHGSVKLKSVIEPVAEALGNTAAISRKSYVHPALIEAAKDAGAIGERPLPRASKYLSSAERGLIEFLDALPRGAGEGGREGQSSRKGGLMAATHFELRRRRAARSRPRRQAWVSGNIVEILVAAAIGIAIALAMLAVRSLGCKLIAPDRRRPALAAPSSPGRWPRPRSSSSSSTSAQLVAEQAEHAAGAASDASTSSSSSRRALQAAIWARELILGYVAHRTGDQEQGTLASAIGIIRLLVTVTLFAIAIILILDNLGVNVTGLIAGLGIGGIAIGLAAQGIFSDLFAALSIIFDKPFRRGDTISFDQRSPAPSSRSASRAPGSAR